MNWKGCMMLNREVKRVPLNFNHPLHKVWSGYLIEDIIEPPNGDGFQCWETTSEGSPITPVFKTFDEMCEWLGNHPRGVTDNFSKQDWINALKDACPVVDIVTKKLELSGKNNSDGR